MHVVDGVLGVLSGGPMPKQERPQRLVDEHSVGLANR